MDATTKRFEFARPSARPAPFRRAPPARLPKATAELVDRLLAARSGTAPDAR